MCLIIENARLVRDTASTAKLVGTINGVHVEVNNCHFAFFALYGVCLWGNHVFIKGIYHYRRAICKFIGNGKYKVLNQCFLPTDF